MDKIVSLWDIKPKIIHSPLFYILTKNLMEKIFKYLKFFLQTFKYIFYIWIINFH